MIRSTVCGALLVASLSAAALVGACGQSGPVSQFGNGGDGGGDGTGPVGPGPDLGDGSMMLGGDADDFVGALVITPLDAVIDVVNGKPVPTLAYAATAGGQPAIVSWSLDRGEIATISAITGVLTPKGSVGGKATVTASYRGKTASTSVTVKIHVVQNGSPQAGDAGAGDGGSIGGNGGAKLPHDLASEGTGSPRSRAGSCDVE